MRICHLSDVHYVNDNRIFYKECSYLAENGYEVTLIGRGKEDYTFTKNGVNCIALRMNYGRMKRFLLGPSKALKQALKVNADVYHLHDPELLLIARKLKKKGKKIVFDSHEDYAQQIKCKSYIPVFLRSIVAKIYVMYESFVINHYLDGFVFPVAKKWSYKIPLTVVGNEPMKTEFVCDISKNKIPRSLVYVGSLTQDRGISQLIEAAYLAHARVLLAGPISSSYLEDLKKKKSFSCVSYFGVLDKSEVGSIIQQAEIGVNALRAVGQYMDATNLSTKVGEFLGYGLPVIINDYPYGRNLIDKYKFGVCINPDDLSEYVTVINSLFSDSNKMHKMSENGKSFVQNYFTWENNSGKNLLLLYGSFRE